MLLYHMFILYLFLSQNLFYLIMYKHVLINRCHPFTRMAATLLFWRVFLNVPTINQKRNIKSCMFDVYDRIITTINGTNQDSTKPLSCHLWAFKWHCKYNGNRKQNIPFFKLKSKI